MQLGITISNKFDCSALAFHYICKIGGLHLVVWQNLPITLSTPRMSPNLYTADKQIVMQFERIFLSASLIAASSFAAHAQSPQFKPNVLLILADDMGWSDIGCYGSEIETPNIDALAKTGVRFRQFHNTSKSWPSRACLLTGIYAQQNGYYKTHTGKLQNCITLGEYMKEAGYITLFSGKHHGGENPRTRGFDHYFGLKDGACNYFNPGHRRPGEEAPAQKNHKRQWCVEFEEFAPYTPPENDFYTTDYFTNYAIRWLEECSESDKPFFLYLAYNAPHDPLMAWPEDIAKYKNQYKKGYEAIRKKRFRKQKRNGLIDDRYELTEATCRKWDSLTPEERDIEQQKMAVYAAMIDRMDQNIGRVISKLKEQGKYENTIIMFMSDNGASAEVVKLNDSYGPIGSVSNWTSLGPDWANVSNTPLRYYKNYSYEGGICTPLIISWENGLKNPGRTSDFPSHFIDMMATLVDLTGVAYPTEYNGRKILPYEGESFLPVVYDKEVTRSKPIFWDYKDGQAVRDGKWKIVRHMTETDRWSLFDMEADPSEATDLADSHPEIVERMKRMFSDWRERVYITGKPVKPL